MFVAVQPVGVAVDAAVFVAEDGLEAGEFPAVRTYAEAVGLFFVATALFEDGILFPMAADTESGRNRSIETGFKHFCRAQPCGDLAVAVHRVFRFALLPVYAAIEHQVATREIRQGVANGEETAVEQTGFVCIRKVFPLGFGVPRPAAFIEVSFAAHAIGAVEGFAAAAIPFDKRGEGEGVAVVFKLLACAEVERMFIEIFMVAVEAAVAERAGGDAVVSFNLPAADGGGFVFDAVGGNRFVAGKFFPAFAVDFGFAPHFATAFINVAVVNGTDGKTTLPALTLVQGFLKMGDVFFDSFGQVFVLKACKFRRSFAVQTAFKKQACVIKPSACEVGMALQQDFVFLFGGFPLAFASS